MKSDSKDSKSKEQRVELKYCEHCGGLWVREGGGGVYCDNCRPKVADLPIPKKRAGRVRLPVRPPIAVEDYSEDEDEMNFEAAAAGGVA